MPGSIVNVISIAELGGQPYLAPYVAAKAGLAGVTRNAAHAHRWDKIRINGLDIGWTATEGEAETQRKFQAQGRTGWKKPTRPSPWESSAKWTRSPNSLSFSSPTGAVLSQARSSTGTRMWLAARIELGVGSRAASRVSPSWRQKAFWSPHKRTTAGAPAVVRLCQRLLPTAWGNRSGSQEGPVACAAAGRMPHRRLSYSALTTIAAATGRVLSE